MWNENNIETTCHVVVNILFFNTNDTIRTVFLHDNLTSTLELIELDSNRMRFRSQCLSAFVQKMTVNGFFKSVCNKLCN